MAYQVLARKWRPRKFEEVVGQGHVTRTLQNAIKQNKLAHAYLFTGTRGVGKTSIARLFAKAIRCENRSSDFNPCLKCVACLDIDAGNSMDYREIDGASNNSVDDVRSLIDNVQYLPTRGQHKIYVIDEVHMLSVSAFNALLKTLEEPPAHVIFILATTDPQKLLGTVISRCQRYDFKNVSVDLLEGHVLTIAKAENIKFSTPKIAHRLAELGKGSVRDTLSIFDQVLGLSGEETLTEESLSLALGLASTTAIKEILTSILTSEPKQCSKVFLQLLEENIDLKKLCDQILDGMYKIINAIDDQQLLYKEDIIAEKALGGVTIAELFWIYETMVKDFNWAMSSMGPDKVVLVLLQKICLRRTILSGDDHKLSDVPQSHAEKKTATIEENTVPRKAVKTWDDFLPFLRKNSPATAANIEHGNLINPISVSETSVSIFLGFPEDSAVFKEYLEEKDTLARLKNNMADFFEIGLDKIQFKTKLLSVEEKKDTNFKTKVEIDDEIKLNDEEAKRQKILNDPYVQEAEKLFNTKIDKIILNQ